LTGGFHRCPGGGVVGQNAGEIAGETRLSGGRIAALLKTPFYLDKESTFMTEAQPAQAPAANSELPLFYKNPQPLEPVRHAKAGLSPKNNFGFSRITNAVALTMTEFSSAAFNYPIVFSTTAPVVPFAVLGIRDNENLFVDAQGQWRENAYIPAYVRRYPFIFSEVPNTDRLVLCVDESAEHYESPSTQPFFIDGKPSDNLTRALQFSEQFHAQLDETRRFCAWLEENKMLEEKFARADMASGESYTMRGFRVVSSEKMNTLTDVQILELHKKGWLALLYFHLQSQQHWPNLSRMVPQAAAAA
jgi:SapC